MNFKRGGMIFWGKCTPLYLYILNDFQHFYDLSKCSDTFNLFDKKSLPPPVKNN